MKTKHRKQLTIPVGTHGCKPAEWEERSLQYQTHKQRYTRDLNNLKLSGDHDAMKVLHITEEIIPSPWLEQAANTDKKDEEEFEVDLEIDGTIRIAKGNGGVDDVETAEEIDEHSNVGELIGVTPIVEFVVKGPAVGTNFQNEATHYKTELQFLNWNA